jgi:hypothetical protein
LMFAFAFVFVSAFASALTREIGSVRNKLLDLGLFRLLRFRGLIHRLALKILVHSLGHVQLSLLMEKVRLDLLVEDLQLVCSCHLSHRLLLFAGQRDYHLSEFLKRWKRVLLTLVIIARIERHPMIVLCCS